MIVVVSKSALDAGLQSDLLAGGQGVKSSDYIEVKHEEDPCNRPSHDRPRRAVRDTMPDTDLTGVIETLDGVAAT